MELLLVLGALYLIVGAVRAESHLKSGRVGNAGRVPTFLATMLLWPLFLKVKQ